ncbi:MAG: TatD family hydrolase [Verrucomicrobiota bacterium]
MRLPDAHCHPQGLVPIPSSQELRRLGIGGFLANGTHPENWEATLRLARAAGGKAALGLHPWQAALWTPEVNATLSRSSSQLVAVGEIGLDGTRRWKAQLPLQKECFRGQLELAEQASLPVVLHGVGAYGSLLEILRERPPACGFLLHGYHGSLEMIPLFLRLGGFFSLGPRELRSEKGRQALGKVPPDRLLLESDFQAQANSPLTAWSNPLREALKEASQVLGRPPENLAASLSANFQELFLR